MFKDIRISKHFRFQPSKCNKYIDRYFLLTSSYLCSHSCAGANPEMKDNTRDKLQGFNNQDNKNEWSRRRKVCNLMFKIPYDAADSEGCGTIAVFGSLLFGAFLRCVTHTL